MGILLEVEVVPSVLSRKPMFELYMPMTLID